MGIPSSDMRRLILIFLLGLQNAASQESSDCPNDWFDANTLGCYKFLESKINMSWVEAQIECEKVGGFLAEPMEESQIQFLSELASLEGSFTGIGYWYLGLTDLGREGNWFWMHNKEEVSNDVWGSKHPSNRTGNSEDCLVMVLRNNEVWWEDHNCLAPDVQHHSVAPVCQRHTNATAAETTTAQPETTTVFRCPDTWTEFDDSCYKMLSAISYWYEAENECRNNGGRLTSVHSIEEETFLNDLAQNNDYWIGGYPLGSSWIWTDGTSYDYDHRYSVSEGYCLLQDNSYYGSGWTSNSCSSSSRSNTYALCKLSLNNDWCSMF